MAGRYAQSRAAAPLLLSSRLAVQVSSPRMPLSNKSCVVYAQRLNHIVPLVFVSMVAEEHCSGERGAVTKGATTARARIRFCPRNVFDLSMPAPKAAQLTGLVDALGPAVPADQIHAAPAHTKLTRGHYFHGTACVRPSRDRCRRGGDGRRFAEERKRSFSETHPLARELRRRVRMKQTPTLTHVQPVLGERLAGDARRDHMRPCPVSLANAVPDHVDSASNTSAAHPVRAKSVDAHSLCVATALVPLRPVNTVVGDSAPTWSAGRWHRRSDPPCTSDSLG